jgi:hypothetical protein
MSVRSGCIQQQAATWPTLPTEPPPAAPYTPGVITTHLQHQLSQPVRPACSRFTQQASLPLLSATWQRALAAWWTSCAMHGPAALARTHTCTGECRPMGHKGSGQDEDLALAWAQQLEGTAARRGGAWLRSLR